MANNWYVITGGPSSGKTTLISELVKDNHTAYPEVARVVIDEALMSGKTVEELRRDERKFQDIVLKRKKSLEDSYAPNRHIFLDRGMHDTTAYYQVYGWELSPEQKRIIASAQYKLVFLLDPLPQFVNDYARTEGQEFTERISDLLRQAYESHGLEVVSVPVVPPKQRAQFILDYIDQKNSGGEN